MEMKLHLISGAELDIQLVDSPLIHEWAQSFCELPLDETEVSRFANRKDKFNQAKFNDLYNQLHNGIARYDTDAVSWTEEVKAGTDHPAIQKQLNDLHHWCVEEVKIEHKHWGAPGHDERIQEFGHLNSLCHQCETLLIEGNRQMPARCTNIYWDQQIVDQFKYAIPITDEWLNLMTTEKYDMYIAKRILGKDYRECYRDYDDAERTEMVPIGDTIPMAFEFDPLNHWNDLIHSPKFLEWLPVADTARNIGRIPIGNLTQTFSNDVLQEMINDDRIKEITIR